MPQLALFRPLPTLALSPRETWRELHHGEEVAGLDDLPVREIVTRLAELFPEARESAGVLAFRAGGGAAEATWSWQHVRLEAEELWPDDRARVAQVAEEFACGVYDVASDGWSPPNRS